MTREQAEQEALRRWGPSGRVRLRAEGAFKGRKQAGRLARYRYEVGNGSLGKACTVLGQGHSWSEAFDDARPREVAT